MVSGEGTWKVSEAHQLALTLKHVEMEHKQGQCHLPPFSPWFQFSVAMWQVIPRFIGFKPTAIYSAHDSAAWQFGSAPWGVLLAWSGLGGSQLGSLRYLRLCWWAGRFVMPVRSHQSGSPS